MKRIILISILLCLGISVSNSWALTNCVGSYLNPWSKLKWTQCKGTYTWPNGGKYVGEYKDGEKHGLGTYTYANGNKHVGEYKDGRRHGLGTATFASGKKYVGGWKDDKFNGQGTYTWPTGEKYVGKFLNGKKHGEGTLTFGNGNKYVGEHQNGNYTGQGTFTFGNGNKYVGGWKNGKRHGQGTATYVSGNKYVGEFNDNKRHGQGTFTFGNGNKYVGEFLNGKYNGQGTLTYPDGTKKDGTWDNNEFLSAQKKSKLESVEMGMTSQEAKAVISGELTAIEQNSYKANMIFSGFDLESGNFLSFTTISDIVRFIELDWKEGGEKTPLMGGRIALGKTTPNELVKELGSYGFRFKTVGPRNDYPTESVFILSYNMKCGGGEIVNFVFGTPKEIIDSEPISEVLDKHTKLKAVILSDLETLQFFWGFGTLEPDTNYRNLECLL